MVPPELCLELYSKMLLIRKFETAVSQLFRDRPELCRGPIHPYAGQEAIAVGVIAHLRKDDYVISTHRGHGAALAKGCNPREVMAEIFGKSSGCYGGKGGSMHIGDMSKGVLCSVGIVGANVPVGTGAALSIRCKGTDQVVACFFGEGAFGQGVVYESLNMASVWKLPVIYICENNLYLTGGAVRIDQVSPTGELAARASAFNIPSMIVDGMDLESVHYAAGRAIEMARRGEGPSLIEAKTYKLICHELGIPDQRPRSEIDEWMAKDPIPRLARRLADMGALSTELAREMERMVEDQVSDAISYAEASSYPPPEELTSGMFHKV